MKFWYNSSILRGRNLKHFYLKLFSIIIQMCMPSKLYMLWLPISKHLSRLSNFFYIFTTWAYILRPCLKFLPFLFNHLPWDIGGWSLENSHWKLIFWKGSRKRLHLQKVTAETCGSFIKKPASKAKLSLFDKRCGSLN